MEEKKEIELRAYEMAFALAIKVYEANGIVKEVQGIADTSLFLEDVTEKQEAILEDLECAGIYVTDNELE